MRRDRRSRLRKLVRLPSLAAAIAERIRHGWSPEQIAGLLAFERGPVRVCHETIYRYAYSPEGQAARAMASLTGAARPPTTKGCEAAAIAPFGAELSIRNRPDKVRERRQFGHWECDLLQFKKKSGKANLTSLVERVRRFSLLLRNMTGIKADHGWFDRRSRFSSRAQRGGQSPSIAGQSLGTGPTFRPAWECKPGSGIRNRRG